MVMMKKKRVIILLSILMIVTAILIWNNFKLKEYHKQEFLLDTVVSIKVYSKHPKEDINQAFLQMRKLDRRLSRYRKGSIIEEINQNAGKNWVGVDDELLNILQQVNKYYKLTAGVLDVTVAPLIDLWGFSTEKPQLPTEFKIGQALDLIDYNDLLIDYKKKRVKLKRRGMKLDLGAVAKGYIVDRIVGYLKKAGVEHAIINAGGNVAVIGTKPDGKDWVIGIKNPDFATKGADEFIKVVEVNDKSVVTSGDYERYFIQDGKKYHHILNPYTGYPARKVRSVTIITNSSLVGDILSTAIFILGDKKGRELINELEDVEGMIVRSDGSMWRSIRAIEN